MVRKGKMKSIVILPEMLGTRLPRSSSHKLDLDILHSLIGYEAVRIDTIVFHGDEYKIKFDESVARSIKYVDFDKELDALLEVEIPDFVAVFDLETLNRVRDKKISNLYLFLSEIPANVSDEVSEFINNTPWVKVISFLPREVIHDRIKVDRYMNPYLHFMGDFDDLKPAKNNVTNIIVPIDFSAMSFYREPPVAEVMELLDKYYPECEVYFAFIGAKVIDYTQYSRVHCIGCHSLGEYLSKLATCDLQVVMNVPDCLNMYPFLALEMGIRTAFYSATELLPELACPFMPKKLIEILGVNDVSVQAELSLIDDLRLQLRSIASRYDEIQFNLLLHTIIRSLDYDYRPEYRKSVDKRLEELGEYYDNHPELMKVKIKEPKDEGNKDNESNGPTESAE